MTKLLILSTHNRFLLITIVLISMIKFSRTTSSEDLPMTDMSADDEDANLEEERRTYDLRKLRHFLLTSNAEQRAAKREQQDFYKRELIHEYLQSMTDPNPNRLQEVKKRFKTYCNSYEDLVYSKSATCG